MTSKQKKNYWPLVLAAVIVLVAGLIISGQDKKPDEPVPAAPVSKPQIFSLTLMHTNDVHSAYGGFTEKNLLCYQPVCEGGKGGSVRLDRAVRAIRQKNPDALLVDAGDEFQGTLYWSLHREKAVSQIIDQIEYTAIIPGNHEFDDGNDTFLRYVKNIETPVLAANITFDPPLPGSERIQPWLVTEQAGRKIGLIGIANEHTPELASPDSGVSFANETETLQKMADELTAQGVDIIIAITHIGLENDKRLARAVTGVDVIAGAHSHSVLLNDESSAEAEGPYPVVEKAPDGQPVLVVTAGTATNYLGHIQIDFDSAGIPVAWTGAPITLNDETLASLNAPAANEKLTETVEALSVPVRAMLDEPLGRIMTDSIAEGSPMETPNIYQCRAGECLTGNIAADALLKIPFADADIVLLNGGGLRFSLPVGQVSAGDVMATMPFQNTPMMSEMPGAVIRLALEHGVYTYGDGEGRFMQTAGLRYSFNPKNEAGSRIVAAEVQTPDEQWQPLDDDRTYKVVVVDFLSRGGDGYTMFADQKWSEAQMLMNDALRLYLEQHSPVTINLEGRIKIVE